MISSLSALLHAEQRRHPLVKRCTSKGGMAMKTARPGAIRNISPGLMTGLPSKGIDMAPHPSQWTVDRTVPGINMPELPQLGQCIYLSSISASVQAGGNPNSRIRCGN